MKKNSIITGGAGFIGSSLAKRLIDEDYKVYILDNLSTGFLSNIPKGAEFIYFDIANQNHYYKISRLKPDVIFHIAGQSSGEISFENPLIDLDINTKGTILLLDFCRAKDVKRFFFTSSMSVYGNRMKAVSEDDMPDPDSFYGVSKLASEKYISVFSKNYNIDYTIFRLFNVYGPMQSMTNMKQGMVSIYMAYLLKGESVTVKGSLERFRDFIYIDDVVECFSQGIGNELSVNKIYNVASGKKTTVKELLDILFKTAGGKDNSLRLEEGTMGDIFGIYANIDKINKDTAWEPECSLENGIRNMYNYYTQEYD